jgi:hypothetical protein
MDLKTTSAANALEPRAVMTTADLAAWEALPLGERQARLRVALDKGIASGTSERTVDDILNAVLVSRVSAGL